MKKILVLVWGLLLSLNFAFASDIPQLILFYWDTCPHCKNEEWFINELSEKYEFDVVGYEVFSHPENVTIMEQYARRLWTMFNWVPVIIMGSDYLVWEGYEKTEAILAKHAQLKEGYTKTSLYNYDSEDNILSLFWIKISLKKVGPVVFGILLWVVDWINPCMFWVLIFLLTYLLSVWSRKKVLYSWLIFIVTTFVLYFVIMYLMHKLIFSTSFLLPYIAYIKYAIWAIAIVLGVIEIKDYFWPGKGISLAIPKAIKPTLEYITKKWTYMSSFVLAVLSTFVELPCTIGIPLAYVGAVGENINIFVALTVYNAFFVLPLLIIVLGIYYWLSAFKSDDWDLSINSQESKKLMRLIAGLILIILGVLFLTRSI